MLRRVVTTCVAVMLIGIFVAVAGAGLAARAPVAYAAAPGGSAESALAIPAGPTSVPLGQRIWYGFQYSGDGSSILIDMSAAPGGSANFSVWTASNVQSWAAGQGENPVGRGAALVRTHRNPDGTVEQTRLYNGDLIWSGSFRIPGTYYVVVDQAGPNPATISLKVTGSGVSALAGAAAQATNPPAGSTPGASPVSPAGASAAPAVAACTPVAARTFTAGGPGSAPGQALALPASGTYLLAAGQRAWYAFQYNGDGSQILIDLRATPDNSANFAVYTPSDTGAPVGRGSQQILTRRLADGTTEKTTLYGGDLIWSGSFRSAGTYYVAVTQTGATPSTITLGISGGGVSGGQAASTLPSRLQPGPACIAQPTAVPAVGTLQAGGPGSAPGRALALPASGTYLLAAGQRAWYAFQYNGDGSQILIDLRATPDNSANFAVYTPSDTGTPVGRGSQQILTRRLADGTTEKTTLYGGDLIWSGSFRSAGTYYVAVTQTGATPSTITLKITGSGVSAPPSR